MEQKEREDSKRWRIGVSNKRPRDRKDSGKTKRRMFTLNMYISSIEHHRAAGGEEVARECERTLTDRRNPRSESFDGWSRELVNIHGPHPPALSAVSAQPCMDGWGILFFAFRKRLSHNNIVVDLENINNTSPLSSKLDLSIILCAGWGGRKVGMGARQTLTARGVFSLYLCVTKATPGTAGVSGNSFRERYWSHWLLLLYIVKLCPHPHTLRKTIQEQSMLKVILWWRKALHTYSVP